MNETPGFFESQPELYDRLIDWPKRLANEEPFYRQIFSEVGASRVLDVACGTGQHAAMFHSWGLQVEGADASPAMIAYCRGTFGEPPGLRWSVRSFEKQAGESDPRFDVVLCVGNSLALAGELDSCRRAMAAMLSWVRPGGAVVVQVLNLWRLPEGPAAWQTPRKFFSEKEEHILLRGLHRAGDRGYVEFIDFRAAAGRPEVGADHAVFLGLEREQLTGWAGEAGAVECEVYGSFQRSVYARDQSQDLILICRL